MRDSGRQSSKWAMRGCGFALTAAVAFIGQGLAHADEADPPSRVARLSYQSGDVAFAAAGEDAWGEADLNRPLSIGDRLSTSIEARAELELGGAELRLAGQSAVNVVNLGDHTAQIELGSGTISLRIRQLDDGETYEIDTPTMAFVANQVGSYRVDVFPDNRGTQVRLYQGGGIAYGEDKSSETLAGNQSYEFHRADLSDLIGAPLPRGDDFDRFCQERDARYRQLASTPYVAPEVIGAVDLADNGEWVDDPDYQQVWYPTTVAAGWAPYRYGRWAWIAPWGWTWVDDAPWGFAPFHYGRWVYLRERWGWVPGSRAVRPVYSPALVGFVGGGGLDVSLRVGGGAPVGWFPLGPRDVYCPPYRVSRGYFSTVNLSNIHSTVNTTVINNYYDKVQVNRGAVDGRFTPDYAYRNRPEATTVVSHDVFAGARPVAGARIDVDARQLATAPLSFQSPALPNRASLGLRAGRDAGARPAPGEVFNRGTVMHGAAPLTPPSFAVRQPSIERSPAQPRPSADQSPNPATAAPRYNSDSGPRFQQAAPIDRATPEQRVPMPARREDDRIEPRPQAPLPQRAQPRPQPRAEPPVQPRPQARPEPHREARPPENPSEHREHER